MLHDTDDAYIRKAVEPFEYKLQNGVVTLVVPPELRIEESAADGTISYRPYVPPSQQEIEARVAKLKLHAHRAVMEDAVRPHLLLMANILIDAGIRTEYQPLKNQAAPGTALYQWLEWFEELYRRIDAAGAPADVVVPPYPPIPQELKWTPAIKGLAAMIGHPAGLAP